MTVILSIRPEHVAKIFSGEKKIELRRRFTKKHVSRALVYETAPTSRIVGELDVSGMCYTASPEEIIETAMSMGAVDKEFFYKYFEGASEAVIIGWRETKRFAHPMQIKSPPQSFRFLHLPKKARKQERFFRRCEDV